MSFMSWFRTGKSHHRGKSALERARKAFRETTMPLISPRRGRRLLRREQVFAVVRESLIRGGVLSTSYGFKVLALDSNGDSFLVLVDLALPPQAMPDEYLLEIERWVQESAKARHAMEVRAVYWRRKPSPEQVGQALRAAMVTQARRESELGSAGTAIPRPRVNPSRGPVQAVAEDEVKAFRDALTAAPPAPYRHPKEVQSPVPEAMSDFMSLSETQHGRL